MNKVEQINNILSLLVTPGKEYVTSHRMSNEEKLIKPNEVIAVKNLNLTFLTGTVAYTTLYNTAYRRSIFKVKQPDLGRSLTGNIRATLDVLNSPELTWLKDSINDLRLDGPVNEPCWDFTSICLRTLIRLCDTLIALRNSHKSESGTAMTGPADVLGARQQANIRTALQLVTCLGIGRNLIPGVGVPLHRRSQFSHFLENMSCASVTISEYEKHCMLYATVCSLHSCCRNAALASFILTKNLNDLLAALCQLCFAPLNKKSCLSGGESASINDEQRSLNAHVLKAERNRTHCFVILTDVLERSFRPIVVRELLRLQGAPKTSDCLVPAPNWLRKATQKLLNEVMVSKGGLLAVIQGILDNGAVESGITEWQTYNVIAKLIGNRLISSQSDCQTNISSQLFELLHLDENPVKRHFAMVVSAVISFTVSIRPEIAEQYLFEPLLRPLILCAKGKAYVGNEHGEITKCILSLHKIFVVGKSPNDEIQNHLTPVFRLIFHLYAFLSQTVSGLRMPVEDLLCTYLRHVETSIAVDRLIEVAFTSDEEDSWPSALTWNPTLEVTLDDKAELSINEVNNPISLELNWLETDSRIVSSVLAVLSRLHNDGIVGKLFLRLLQDLSSLVGNVDSSCAPQRPDLEDQKSDLVHIERASRLRETRIRQSLLTFHFLSSLCDNADLQESILKDNKQTFQFLHTTLERGAVLCSSKPEDLEPMEAETLTMAMGILTLMLGVQGEDNRKLASVSVPHLQTLKSMHSSEGVRNLAEDLLTAIATRPSQTHSRRDEMTRFQEAWERIFDPEVPIRGHAMLALTKLITANDKETMDHCDQLFVAFQENIKHQDSYVYLMSVQGLAALAGRFPDKVVPILTEEFSNAATQRFDAEMRMKFGEVLVKVTRILGEMVPKYRDRLLNAFLATCRDADPFVRSSGLSNLGEACKELRYALGSNVHEIFGCLSSYAKCDSSIHVRRAAVQVIVLILRGLGKDAFNALEPILKDLYRLVKHVYRTDRDDIVKLHAQLALEELQVICRDFLFPKVTLEKRITVVRP